MIWYLLVRQIAPFRSQWLSIHAPRNDLVVMNMNNTLLQQIQQAFRAMRNPEQALHMKAYMLNQFEFIGIRATPRRQTLKTVVKAWPKATFTRACVLKLAKQLWQLPGPSACMGAARGHDPPTPVGFVKFDHTRSRQALVDVKLH